MPLNINLDTIKAGLYSEIVSSNPGLHQPFISPHLGPGSIRAQANRIVKDLTQYTEASIKLALLESVDLLIEDTPKDTTWAASSWFPGYGQAFDNGGYLVDPEVLNEFDILEGETLLETEELIRLRNRQAEQMNAMRSFRATRIFVNQYVHAHQR